MESDSNGEIRTLKLRAEGKMLKFRESTRLCDLWYIKLRCEVCVSV